MAATGSAQVVRSEFIYTTASFPSAHASTLVETPGGLVAAWFGGTREGANDVEIWLSREQGGVWSTPEVVGTGQQPDGTRFPCWNPVLFRSRSGTLSLFYKIGPAPARWWGMVRTSTDDGRTWSTPRRLPDGVLGPIKNKPIQLAEGTIVSPSSTETTDSPSRWRVHMELSKDDGATWTVVRVAGDSIEAIQPSILALPDGVLQAIGRTRSGRTFTTRSTNAGTDWTPLTLGELPNPNSGIDALTLKDGRHLIVYNNTPRGRTPLNVATSVDGMHWTGIAELETEPGEFSYPAVIQTSDGLVHITYTWNRQRIKHVVFRIAP